jgi:hypothetical protein
MSAPNTAALSEEERYELELAEQARLNSGSWDSVAPGKAANFQQSFFRMIGLLGPYKWWFVFVSVLGAIGVVLAVIAPKVLGEATNMIFEGVVSSALGGQFPPGRRRPRSSTRCAQRTRTTSRTSSRRCRTSRSGRASTSSDSSGCSSPSWRSTSCRRC